MKIKRPEAIGGSRTFLSSEARRAPGKDYQYAQHFNPKKCLGPGPQFFPALTDLPVVKAGEAAHMREGDYVVGLTLGGVDRAYPWWILDNSHAYNDIVETLPLLVIL
ncbi:MAG: hypothetical protein ACE5JX_18185 [Acidobacteriota bacterium]